MSRGSNNRRQDPEALRQSEEKFRLLVEAVQDYAIFILDPTGVVLSWNSGAERIKGYRAEEIVGAHFSRFYPKAAVERGWPQMELDEARAKGRFEDEGWRVRKDGSRFWANVVITALHDDERALVGFAEVTRDLTERQQAEERLRAANDELERRVEERTAELAETNRRLREQRERLRVTLESIGDAVIVADTGGRVSLLNPVAESMTGWSKEEASGQPLHAVFPIFSEATGEPIENPVEKVMREGTVVGLGNHTELVARDGTRLPIDDSAAPIKDADGNLFGIVLVFRDVTERRKADRDLRESEDRLRAIIRNWPAALFVKDADGRYLLANGACQQFAGVERERIVGHTDYEFQPRELADRIRADDRRAIVDGETLRFEEQRTIGGKLRSFLTVKFPLVDASGRRHAVCGIATDVSDLKSAEQALREADRRKDEFLAMLAHELRNPLAPIRNALQIMKMPEADAQAVGQARDVTERQVQHMVRLVDDLLDVSRIMRGRIELRRERIDLKSAVASAIETAHPILDAQGQKLVVSLPPEPVWLEADKTRLAQVVGNLLHNAAKFSSRAGSVWLTLERQGGEALVRVRDEGIGIARDQLPHLFDLFVQGDQSLERSRGGLGIGLTLVKKLVEMHGGTIAVQSKGPGTGSEFTVRLPAHGVEAAATPAAEGALLQPSSRRILVVDDNVDAAESVVLILGLSGHQVRMAHTGPEALQVAAEFRPDVIVLDIGLPGINGYEVARRLRQEPAQANVLLIAMTGYGQEDDRRRSSEVGFDHHLVKPVDPEVLANLVAEHRSRDR